MKFRVSKISAVVTLVLVISAHPSPAATAWAPSDTAAIHPGVPVVIGDALCTSNFVFEDPAGSVYLGLAAHCAGVEDPGFDGCRSQPLPLGTPAEVWGATHPAMLVYSSWLAMQTRVEADIDTCLFNDFALVKLDAADAGRVNPSMPFWGGPSGIVPGSSPGAAAFSYGVSLTDTGLQALPKTGISLRQGGNGWIHVLDLDPIAIEGDSGSGVMDGQGRAFAVLSTLSFRRGVNGATDLSRALDYARSSGFPQLALVTGTMSFNPTGPAQGNLLADLLAALLGG